jgi:phage shock protein PspC (stress-responsive transcriptional regulator)
MKRFKTIDVLLGWITFAIAAFVYCSTIEPTASFWDCPEFITTAFKLEVGHPPGAPFFMLTGNLFSQFVSDPSDVARMVNTMSALLSAACILFLFWTITHLARKLICDKGVVTTTAQMITIEACGLVGALAYTFSDTFWFSAVEGEVYAYSSMFTALVFWLILKWEDAADSPHSDRWLILIAYLTGLSIGVHLLNLLCIPAIVLVYYYKKCPNANLVGSLVALVVSMVLVAVVLYGIVPGIVKVGGWFELLFVNELGCGFNTGLIIYILLLVACVIWAVYESYVVKSRLRMNISFLCSIALLGIPFYGYGTSSIVLGVIVLVALYVVLNRRNAKGVSLVSPRVLNTTLLCLLMIMVGYSSYAVIVIRSTANTPMDQNSPEDIFTLGQYLNREQYGSRPLFYGQAYTSQVAFEQQGNYLVPIQTKGSPVYQRKEKASPDEPDSYEHIRDNGEYVYAQNMLFPRMYSDAHAELYEKWMGGVTGTQVPYTSLNGETTMVKMPTQWENLRFFFSYQVNFMYWRYFMWNFAGRQNDYQGYGEVEHGNWITGIKFIDDALLGVDTATMPDNIWSGNKGHNVFYCLPLILGLLGLFRQAYDKNPKGVQQFWVVFFLFFMTGIAIVLYLNQTPQQPRERDYAYAGSFYAFAIWIGLGVAAVAEGLKKLKLNDTLAASLAGVICILVPIQMGGQTWDDHDRSGRYTCRDFGRNYLMTLPENQGAVIFTNGDNDTFPLWYNQETEGERTDARVCNLSYLQTDWYIDQMKRPAYDSPALPIHWDRLHYVSGTNEYVRVRSDVKDIIRRYYEMDPETMTRLMGKDPFDAENVMNIWLLDRYDGLEGDDIELLQYLKAVFCGASMDNPSGVDTHIIPTDSLVITVDKAAVKKSGMLIPGDSIPDKMVISLQGKRALTKSELMMIEMISQSNWKTPIYMSMTVGTDNWINLGDYFVKEGLAYRITPFKNEDQETAIDTDKMYDNIMNKFRFGGLEQKGLYIDETVMRMCYTHRRVFVELIEGLLREGKFDKANKALAYCEKVLPDYNVPHEYWGGSLTLATAHLLLNQESKGVAILDELADNSLNYLRFYSAMSPSMMATSSREINSHLYVLRNILEVYPDTQKEKKQKLLNEVQKYFSYYGGKMGV